MTGIELMGMPLREGDLLVVNGVKRAQDAEELATDLNRVMCAMGINVDLIFLPDGIQLQHLNKETLARLGLTKKRAPRKVAVES